MKSEIASGEQQKLCGCCDFVSLISASASYISFRGASVCQSVWWCILLIS